MVVSLPDQACVGYAFASAEDSRTLEAIAGACSRPAIHRCDGSLILSVVLPPESPWNPCPHHADVIGGARIFVSRTADEIGTRTADPRLYASLLPAGAAESARPEGRLAWRAGVALWEPQDMTSLPGSRRFVAAIANSAGSAAESLFWSSDGAEPPPLARYLLHAARRDADRMARERRVLETRAGGLTSLAAGPSLFAADAELAGAELADAGLADAGPAASPRWSGEPDADPSRNVFVIYGRDEKARQAIFDFLRALGLNPLEWETLLQRKGDAAPYLGDAVRSGLDAAAAVVALMTPDDVVRLHPELHESGEKAGETCETLQPRPNVLIELGMALAAKNGKTVLLKAGDQRDITDLAGYSYVRLADTPECRIRLRQRLEAAGCRPAASTDWLTAGDFAALSALHRRPRQT